MERESNDELGYSCKVLLTKIIKEKQFYWKRNICFSLFSIICVILPLTLSDNSNIKMENRENHEIFEPEKYVS
jgi:hypothetical protein